MQARWRSLCERSKGAPRARLRSELRKRAYRPPHLPTRSGRVGRAQAGGSDYLEKNDPGTPIPSVVPAATAAQAARRAAGGDGAGAIAAGRASGVGGGARRAGRSRGLYLAPWPCDTLSGTLGRFLAA